MDSEIRSADVRTRRIAQFYRSLPVEGFVKEVTRFLSDRGLSNKWLAKRIGLSDAVVSQFLAGKHPGDNDEVRHKIDQALNIHREREANRLPVQFVETHQ